MVQLAAMVNKAFFRALQNDIATMFVQDSLCKSYSYFFPLNEKEVKNMINRAFSLLIEAGKKDNSELLSNVIKKIHKEIFLNKDQKFWFSLLYRNYKISTRSKVDFDIISPHIQGSVLDFGSNGGYYALELLRNGFRVQTTDILDYRDKSAKHIPFIQMKKPGVIPFTKNSFDTTIVKTVFHHIDDNNLIDVLKSLHSISKRLIIKEDIYGVTEDNFLQEEILENDLMLKKYLEIGSVNQYDVLVLVDFFGNIIAHGVDNMSLPFNFKTLEEWKVLLSSVGYKITKIRWYGFEKTKLHQNLQAWFICERK